ncbi:protein FRA10AC1 homolog [Rhinophrynus dorsalis]
MSQGIPLTLARTLQHRRKQEAGCPPGNQGSQLSGNQMRQRAARQHTQDRPPTDARRPSREKNLPQKSVESHPEKVKDLGLNQRRFLETENPTVLLQDGHTRGLEEYDSDFSDEEYDKEKIAKRDRLKKEEALLKKPFQKEKHGKVAHRQVAADEWDREEARNWRVHLISMDAFARHQKFVNDYILYYGGKLQDFQRSKGSDKTDLDVIRENHRFLWQEEDEDDMTWEKKLAKKYYDKLFKEYCIADLSKYKENKFGFRWRVEKEVISGKGQFCCGNKRCDEKEGLKSWEVNFGYVEHGEKKNALVKLRLCPECSYRLNFHHRRREVQPNKKKRELQKEQGESSRKVSKESHPRKKKRRKDTSSDQHEDSSERDTDDEGGDGKADADFWKGSHQETDEKTREEEFDEYFQDMFL